MTSERGPAGRSAGGQVRQNRTPGSGAPEQDTGVRCARTGHRGSGAPEQDKGAVVGAADLPLHGRDQSAAVQERFVDTPAEAVGAAHTLIGNVMRDRGYPVDDRTATLDALSVRHGRAMEGYRTT